MSIEAVLFALRVLSAIALAGVLFALFWALTREFRWKGGVSQSNRRQHGKLVRLMEMDGGYLALPESYALYSPTSIGRAPTNTVPLDDNFASSEHAQLAMRQDRWWLEDRGSRNGTLLNGAPLTQPTIVADGDIISIGQVHLRLQIDE